MADLTSVWVPYGEEYHDWDDHPDWWAMEVDYEDHRFDWFATYEACRTECDRRNKVNEAAFRAQYEIYALGVLQKNEQAQKTRRVAETEHLALVAAGLRQPRTFAALKPETPETFEQWSRGRNTGPRWKPAELRRSEHDDG